MRTLLWSYLGCRSSPRELSAFEMRRFFSLAPENRLVLRRRFRSRARLGAAIQLGLVRMTGTTLDTLDHVPRAARSEPSPACSINSARPAPVPYPGLDRRYRPTRRVARAEP